jgi:hypothetical protein
MAQGKKAVSVFDHQHGQSRRGAQMFALTFLGTSASVPSAERNHPGLLVEAANPSAPLNTW